MIEKTVIDNSSKLRSRLIFCHSIANFLFNKFRFLSSRTLARLFSHIILPPLKGLTVCPTIYGFDILLHAEKNSEIYEIYNLGFYEAGTLDVLKKCLHGNDVFIDAGASIGLMSLYASQLVGMTGKIHAFEPTKKSYDIFYESVALNRFTNISVHKMGLGNENRMIPIYTNRACPSMLELNDKDPHEIVEIDRLDDVLAKEAISEVRMMKIDVEGFELEVLKGSAKLLAGKNAPIVCIEYMEGLVKNKGDNAFSYLRKINNYRFYQLSQGKNLISKLIPVENMSEFKNDDNIFCFLDSHIASLPKDMFVK
jgi:FkbM family methyltransferase